MLDFTGNHKQKQNDMSNKTQHIVNIMGVKVPMSSPSTPAAFDELYGPNACLEMALDQAAYRDFHPVIRALTAEKLEALTEVKRPIDPSKTKKVKDAAGNVVDEPVLVSEQVYVNMLLSDGKITDDDFEKLVLSVARDYGDLRPLPSTRASRVPKQYLTSADAILAAINSGTHTEQGVRDKWEALNGAPFPAGEFNRETLGKALQLNDERVARESRAQLLG